MTFPTIDVSSLGPPFAAKWQDYCLRIDQPLADTLSSQDAMRAAFTAEVRTVWPDLPLGHYGDIANYGGDPATYLWAAHAISLGRADLAEKVFNALMKFAKESIDQLNSFNDTMDGLFVNWQGVAAMSCRDYVGSITGFIEAQRAAALDLAAVILAFRAVVETGQKDLATIMTALENAVDQKLEAERKAAHDALIHDLERVGLVALAFLAGAVGQPEVTVLLSLASAVATIGAETIETQQAVIDAGQGWDVIRASYMALCHEVRDAVGQQIEGRILTKLADVELKTPPRLPAVSASQIGYDQAGSPPR